MKIYNDEHAATVGLIEPPRHYLPFLCPHQQQEDENKQATTCGSWCPAFRYNEKFGKVRLKCFPQELIFDIEE